MAYLVSLIETALTIFLYMIVLTREKFRYLTVSNDDGFLHSSKLARAFELRIAFSES